MIAFFDGGHSHCRACQLESSIDENHMSVPAIDRYFARLDTVSDVQLF